MNENKKIRKGIVVDILNSERKVIVLMPDGDMQKVRPHRPYDIGEEISFRQEIEIKKGLNWSRVIRYASAVCVAFLLIMASIFSPVWNVSSPKDVYADIFIESKSDVQVKLTKEQEVVEVIPLNKSGTRVASNLDSEGEPVTEFINDYFEEMKKEGYIGAEDKAIISVVSDDHIKTRDDILRNIRETIEQSDFIKSNEIEVLTVPIPYQTALKAYQLGVTPGKFSIAMIADSVGEENTPSLGMLKLLTVTELVDANPEATKILAGSSEVELVELTEQQKPGSPIGAEDGQPITAMNPPVSNQAVEEKIQHKASEAKQEPEIQSGTASSGKQSKPANDVSNTSGNSKPESRPEQTPPPQGNEEPSKPPKKENPAGQEPANPPSDKPPAGEEKPPSDKQPADSDQDGNTGSEEKPAEDGDKEKQNEDKNPHILDQVVSLVLKIRVL